MAVFYICGEEQTSSPHPTPITKYIKSLDALYWNNMIMLEVHSGEIWLIRERIFPNHSEVSLSNGMTQLGYWVSRCGKVRNVSIRHVWLEGGGAHRPQLWLVLCSGELQYAIYMMDTSDCVVGPRHWIEIDAGVTKNLKKKKKLAFEHQVGKNTKNSRLSGGIKSRETCCKRYHWVSHFTIGA